eukprot:Plantae.Rhodophyta-Rhodochaete_pulchella.ctg10512.p1 GENE.Plantae.Rhodophyta-Rhodochaete_pulchella.ctg10512~~Plantae.Rhodophyta-Rhodochaete_pulchella.ctg10512.p1  ORF type:complete len:407 (+),score=17.27 Plantae.Rhodophyta-Rhodochaete_pulchella.ctg10512:204-1424(+)
MPPNGVGCMEQVLHDVLGTDRESLIACDYLLNDVADDESFQSLPFLSRSSFESLLELDFRLGIEIPGFPPLGQWQSIVLLPEHYHGRYVLGIAACCNPPYLVSLTLGLNQWTTWKPKYTSLRFVYDKHCNTFSWVSRFGVALGDEHSSEAGEIHGLELFRLRLNVEYGWCIEDRIYVNEQMIGIGVVATRCDTCTALAVHCRCYRSRIGPTEFFSAPMETWDHTRQLFSAAFTDSATGLQCNSIRSFGRARGSNFSVLGSLQLRSSLSLSVQAGKHLQNCYPTAWIGPIYRVPYLEVVDGSQNDHAPVESRRPEIVEGDGFSCPICKKAFVRRGNVTRHLRSVHGEVRRFQCEICRYCFKHRYHLEAHMENVHFGRKFNCQECGVGFSSNSNLARHLRRRHSDRGV